MSPSGFLRFGFDGVKAAESLPEAAAPGKDGGGALGGGPPGLAPAELVPSPAFEAGFVPLAAPVAASAVVRSLFLILFVPLVAPVAADAFVGSLFLSLLNLSGL